MKTAYLCARRLSEILGQSEYVLDISFVRGTPPKRAPDPGHVFHNFAELYTAVQAVDGMSFTTDEKSHFAMEVATVGTCYCKEISAEQALALGFDVEKLS